MFGVRIGFVFTFVFVCVKCDNEIKKQYLYKYKKGCQPLEKPAFQSTEKNLGLCVRRCHLSGICVSVAYNHMGNDCLGFTNCPRYCRNTGDESDWRNYCEGNFPFAVIRGRAF